MAMFSLAKVTVDLRRDDGSIITLHEGDIVHGLRYKSGNEDVVIDGAVRVINATTKANNALPSTCPPEPYLHKFITINSLVIDSSDTFDAELTRISVSNIVDIESVETDDATTITVGSGPQFKPLDEVIANAPDGTTVSLAAGTYEAPLTINKSVRIISENGAALSAPIVVDAPVMAMQEGEPVEMTVELVGLNLTGDALITVNTFSAGIVTFVMKSCTFGGHNLTTRTMPIAVKNDNPCIVQILDCTFEDQNEYAYNLIDVNGKLMTGSAFIGNTFSLKSCAHNQISLYGMDDGALIEICDNYAVRSANMVRIGFKGAPKGTVIMHENRYDLTDTDPWGGLFLVQPFNNKTETFAGVTINVSETKKPDGQLCYLYASGNDTPWTETNKPAVFVDGEPYTVPDASPAV